MARSRSDGASPRESIEGLSRSHTSLTSLPQRSKVNLKLHHLSSSRCIKSGFGRNRGLGREKERERKGKKGRERGGRDGVREKGN